MTQRGQEGGGTGAEAPTVATVTRKQRRLPYITVHYSGGYSATTQASDGEVFVLSARQPVWSLAKSFSCLLGNRFGFALHYTCKESA